MLTKTYDGQTARFLATVVTCMPPLSGDVMQGWIDNPKALKNFLSGFNPSTTANNKWREEDGVIYFWVERDNSETTEIAVLKGMLFADQNRSTKKIRAYAEAFRAFDNRYLEKPNAELTRLICKKFSHAEIEEEMGLRYIIIMHEPIIAPGSGDPYLTRAGFDNGPFGYAYSDKLDSDWPRDCGFAFKVSSH